MSDKIKKIQEHLNLLGYNAGIVDGIRGRNTINAIKRFQADKKIKVDGLVGPQTYSILFGISKQSAPNVDMVPWLEEGFRVEGMHEVRNHSKLAAWLRRDGSTVGDPARIPWCGDFAQTAILLAMPEEPMVTNPYLAANWTKFGQVCEPQYGSILSFWRGSPKSWKGHVAFYIGEDADNYYVLGGNQGNTVSRTFIAKNRLRKNGSRWPSTGMKPNNKKIFVSSGGSIISENEV